MFVLLEHFVPGQQAPGVPAVHWDLMLETTPDAAALRTWRLHANPLSESSDIAAVPLGDHRRVYLDLEGDIGRGRGVVRRVDRGPARVVSEDGRGLHVELHGDRLRGEFVLRSDSKGQAVFARISAGVPNTRPRP